MKILSEARFEVKHGERTKPVFLWIVLAIIVAAAILGIQVAEGYTIDPGTPGLVILIFIMLLTVWAFGKGATYEWSTATWK